MPRGAPLLGSGLRRFRYRCVDRPPWMTWHRVSVHYWTERDRACRVVGHGAAATVAAVAGDGVDGRAGVVARVGDGSVDGSRGDQDGD